MGLFKKGCWTNPTIDSAPNPSNFKVLKEVKYGELWLSVIEYPNCTNYEGKKILITLNRPSELLYLDPHFSVGGTVIARFQPTKTGWELGKKLCESIE